MADEQQLPADNQQPDQAAIQAEVAQQMAQHGIIQPTAAPVIEPAAAVVTPAPEATVVADPFGIFKTEFGYETPEAAVQDIKDLRAFKAAPKYPELEAVNPEAAALLKAIASGDKQKAHQWLDQELKIERLVGAEVTKDTAADIVKLGMQLKYKNENLTAEEINHKFNKQYGVPPKPTQGADEEQVDYDSRVSQWQEVANDKLMDLMIDAKLAKPELQNSKSKLVFPEIETPVDPAYVQWKKSLEESTKIEAETMQAYKAFTPKQIETVINFKDEANKIDFNFQYEPDADSFKRTQDMAMDFDKFYQLFYKPDGTPDRKEFLEAIHFAVNRKNIILSAINQGKNAAIKATLPDNTTGGLVRQIAQPQQEPSELDQQMRLHLKGFGGF